MSLSGGHLSYAGCNGDYRYGYITKNDNCESALGGATQNIAIGGRVKINSAAAISDGARNKWYARGPRKDDDNTTKWSFYHLLPDKVKEIFLRLAIIMVPETRSNGNSAIERFANRQLTLEELTRQAGMKRALDELLENMLYYNMWITEACMKEVSQVNITLKWMTTKTEMFDFVKENINIRVKGFGDVKDFSEFNITLSKKGKNKEVQELATHS